MKDDIKLILMNKIIEHTKHPTESRSVNPNDESEVMRFVFNQYLDNKKIIETCNAGLKVAKQDIEDLKERLTELEILRSF